MPDPERDTFLGTATDVMALWVDLAGYELEHSPRRLLEAIQSERFRNAVTRALRQEGERLLERQRSGEATTVEDGNQVLRSVGEAGAEAVGREVLAGVQRSSRYREAESRMRQLGQAFQRTPVGIFLNEHRTALIIVAAGVGVGGATAMYITRSGDMPADWATRLAQRALRFRPLGNLEIRADEVVFVPSERRVGGQVTVSANWRRLTTTFSANVVFQGPTVVRAGGSAGAHLVLPVGGRTELDLQAGLRYQGSRGDAGPSGPWQSDLGGQLRMLMRVRGTGSRPTVSLSLGVEAGSQFSPAARPQTDVRVLGGLRIDFN